MSMSMWYGFSFPPCSAIAVNGCDYIFRIHAEKTPKFAASQCYWTRRKFIWFLRSGENASFLRRNNLIALYSSAVSPTGVLSPTGDKSACSGL